MRLAPALLALLSLFTLSLALAGGGASTLRFAPNFEVTDLSGEHASLVSFRGHVVIVQFGDVGCAVCRAADLLLRQYQLEYVDRGLVVISLDEHTHLETLRRYDAQFMFSTLTGIDPGQVVARRYHISVLPTTVFIDRAGIIRDVRHGRLTEGQLVRRLQSLL